MFQDGAKDFEQLIGWLLLASPSGSGLRQRLNPRQGKKEQERLHRGGVKSVRSGCPGWRFGLNSQVVGFAAVGGGNAAIHELFGQREHTKVIGQSYYSPVTATDSTSLFSLSQTSDIDCCIPVNRMPKSKQNIRLCPQK